MGKKQPVCDEQCFSCEFPDCIWEGYETAVKKTGYRDAYYAANRERILARKKQQYHLKKGVTMARIEGAGRSDLFTLDPEIIVIPEDGPLFDERSALPLDESLVLNIMFQGVLEPIIVRKNGPTIEVVAGRQRVKATREANRRLAEMGKAPIKIPAILKQGSDAEMYGILISENEIRRADDQVAKGKKALRLMNLGYTVPDIAVVFGVSHDTVRRWLALNDLTPEVQEAVSTGEIPAGAGRVLAALPREEQAAKLDELRADDQPVTAKKAERAVQGIRGIPDGPKMMGRKSIDEALEEIGTCPQSLSGEYLNGLADALFWVLGRIDKTWNTTPEEAA